MLTFLLLPADCKIVWEYVCVSLNATMQFGSTYGVMDLRGVFLEVYSGTNMWESDLDIWDKSLNKIKLWTPFNKAILSKQLNTCANILVLSTSIAALIKILQTWKSKLLIVGVKITDLFFVSYNWKLWVLWKYYAWKTILIRFKKHPK